MQTKCKVLNAIQWRTWIEGVGLRVGRWFRVTIYRLGLAPQTTAVFCYCVFSFTLFFFGRWLCANFVQMNLLLSHRTQVYMRVAGAMVLQALHISNVPALPIGSIFMPVSRQLLATGPTVACHSVCVSVLLVSFWGFSSIAPNSIACRVGTSACPHS